MKNVIIKIIQHQNSANKLDNALNTTVLFQFFFIQISSLIRGFRILFFFRKPKGMILGKGVSFFNISKIKWGKNLRLGNHVYISGLSKNGVEFGNNVSIGAFSRVVVSTSLNNIGNKIIIGNNVSIGEFSYLGGAGGLEIGNECIIEQYLSCHPESHNYGDLETEIRQQGVSRKGIKIGKNCWIGSKVTLQDGVTIGNGSIIAAGSVVTKSFSENSIIGGVPAKLIKSRKNDLQNYYSNLLSCKPL